MSHENSQSPPSKRNSSESASKPTYTNIRIVNRRKKALLLVRFAELCMTSEARQIFRITTKFATSFIGELRWIINRTWWDLLSQFSASVERICQFENGDQVLRDSKVFMFIPLNSLRNTLVPTAYLLEVTATHSSTNWQQWLQTNSLCGLSLRTKSPHCGISGLQKEQKWERSTGHWHIEFVGGHRTPKAWNRN